MKTVRLAATLPVIVLSLILSAAGQAGSNSLDDQLFQATQKGDAVAVGQLLEKGANIEAKEAAATRR